jgi:hypothetical protein
MLLVLGLWIFRQADLPPRLGAVALFAGGAFVGETITWRTTRHAAEAEKRNREVARFHRLEVEQ